MVEYLCKSSVLITVFYGIYFLIFKHFTFHALNRALLLILTIYALACPLLQIEIQQATPAGNIELLLAGSQDFLDTNKSLPDDFNKPNQPWKFIFLAYWIGVTFLFTRFLIQFHRILKIKKNSNKTVFNNHKVFISRDISQPFSFFNWIFIPLKNNLNLGLIVQHEKTHARQLHSLDKLFLELISIFYWFHPVVYLVKRSLTRVHEYQVDLQVIQEGRSSREYMHEILKAKAYPTINGLTNFFHGNILKKRVMMMVKRKTPKISGTMYVLMIPLFIMFMFTSAVQTFEQGNIPSIKPILEENIIRISSGYGMRKHPISGEMKMHHAIDIVAKQGTPVIAAADGRIIKKEFKQEGKGHGRLILVQHDQFYTTLYTQLSDFNVEINQQVKQGDIIGFVGSSGISTGPHLHYEVWKEGEKVDPEKYFITRKQFIR